MHQNTIHSSCLHSDAKCAICSVCSAQRTFKLAAQFGQSHAKSFALRTSAWAQCSLHTLGTGICFATIIGVDLHVHWDTDVNVRA